MDAPLLSWLGRSSSMSNELLALKEWASAITALESGRQLVLMRKGGISEETKHFELKNHSFFLYPTYEHQRTDLIKSEFRSIVDHSQEKWDPDAREVTISSYAEVAEDMKITTEEQVRILNDFHIWTDAFAEERLRWKRNDPLHVLLLRVYRLHEPINLPIEPSYGGCKSWISLPKQSLKFEADPVIDTTEFANKARAIRRSLMQI